MKWTYERVPLRRYARRFQDCGAVDGTVDPYYEPLAASAGIAPAGPTPVGSAMLQGAVDWAAAPGRTMAQRQPQAGEMWSDEDGGHPTGERCQ
jgi:hypothetical protein